MDNLNTLAEATLSTYQPGMSNVTSSPSNSRVIERTPRTITLPVSGQILHVSVEAPDLSVARVGERIKEGGHDVPEEKIGKCFDQNGAFIKQVTMLSDLGSYLSQLETKSPCHARAVLLEWKAVFCCRAITSVCVEHIRGRLEYMICPLTWKRRYHPA